MTKGLGSCAEKPSTALFGLPTGAEARSWLEVLCAGLRALLHPALTACLATIMLLTCLAPAQNIQFRDITSEAGIHFVHNNGAFGKKYLPETMGPGCAFIDYDNDGWPDILLINGQNWVGHSKSGPTTPKLYHNNHDGTFTGVTRRSGLGISMYGLGAAIGD